MPATLSEAFKPSTFGNFGGGLGGNGNGGRDMGVGDTRTYSIRNNPPGSNESYNSFLYNTTEAPASANRQKGASVCLEDSLKQSNPNGLVGGSVNKSQDTISLLSSMDTASLHQSDTLASNIRSTYRESFQNSQPTQELAGAGCDQYITHILGCARCRRRLRQMLVNQDDIIGGGIGSGSTEGENMPSNTAIKRQLDEIKHLLRTGRVGAEGFTAILANTTVQNVGLYVLFGIFLILVMDIFTRF